MTHHNASFKSRKQWLAAIQMAANPAAPPQSGDTATISKHGNGDRVEVILNELVEIWKQEQHGLWTYQFTFTELNREQPAPKTDDPWTHINPASVPDDAPF